MMPNDIIIAAETFSATVVKPTSTIRTDAARSPDAPATMTVSHETAKNGKVSSVVIFDDTATVPCNDACSVTPGLSNTRAMFKIQYNPLDGRESLSTHITIVIAQLKLFMADDDLMTKFQNKEH